MIVSRAHRALREDLTLEDTALRPGVDEVLHDRVVDPGRLTRPGAAAADGT